MPIKTRVPLPAAIATILLGLSLVCGGQGTRLLRQPTISGTQIAFEYGGDIWIVDKNGGDARRITSTPAVEANPHYSPDGEWLAFSSDRSGVPQVYIVPVSGGDPTCLTWYPAGSYPRGWTPDGKQVLYACSRETAPTGYNRLWTVSTKGGPSTLLPAPWGFDGNYSPDGKKLIVDRVSRWDVEWRHYRGGQNTPLQVLDLSTLTEQSIPTDGSEDIRPVWMGDEIFFLSDRDFIMNVWAYKPSTNALRQVTSLKTGDIKWLSGNGKDLVYERDGYINTLDPTTGASRQLTINVTGDFPWAETRTENVTGSVSDASLSPTGKRILYMTT